MSNARSNKFRGKKNAAKRGRGKYSFRRESYMYETGTRVTSNDGKIRNRFKVG